MENNNGLFDPRKTNNIKNNNNIHNQTLVGGLTLFHLCVGAGLEQEVFKLLPQSNINAKDDDGDTPLNFAIICEQPNMVRILLEKGASFEMNNNKGAYPVHLAIGKNEEVAIQILTHLKDVRADINRKEQFGTRRTVLHLAAENDLERVFNFLYYSCNCRIEKNENNKFPHEVAPSNGKVKVLWKKIYDAEVDKLFHVVDTENGSEITKILEKKVVSNTSKNRNGQPVLHFAISQGLVTAALFLIRYGTIDDKRDMLAARYGRNDLTPLHEACIQGQKAVVSEIVANRYSIQFKDTSSNTALHYAIKHKRDEIALILVKGGAPVDVANSKGETPISIASESLRKQISDILKIPPNKIPPNKVPPNPAPPKPFPEPGPSYPEIPINPNNAEFRQIGMNEIQKTLNEKKEWKIIGKGAFSNVYLGIYKNTQVAVKQIPFSSSGLDFENSEGFKMITKIKDEYLNHVYGYIKHETSIFIVSNYAANGSLMDYILKNGSKISLKMKIQYALAITEAIMRIHGFKVAHTDLRTSAFLVTHDKQLKMTDLRVALLIRSTGGRCRRYTAPELLEEEVPKSAYFKADIFSIGIIFWELFSNKEAFEGMNQFKIMTSISEGRRPPLSAVSESVIQTIIDGCWKQKPEERPDITDLFHSVAEADRRLSLS